MKQYTLTHHRTGSQLWYLDTEDRSEEVSSRKSMAHNLCWHRSDGPAIIYSDGTQAWYLNNKQHREDGPAIIWADGRQSWWVSGKLITNEYDLSLFDSEEGRMILAIKYGRPI